MTESLDGLARDLRAVVEHALDAEWRQLIENDADDGLALLVIDDLVQVAIQRHVPLPESLVDRIRAVLMPDPDPDSEEAMLADHLSQVPLAA